MCSFRSKLSFGEKTLLFSVKNYCPSICLIRHRLEKDRVYQLGSQIWRQQHLVAVPVFSSPCQGAETFLLQRQIPLLHLQKRLGLKKTLCTQINTHPAHLLTAAFFLASSLSRSHSCSPLLSHSTENLSPDS